MDTLEKRTVKEVIERSLKKRDNEEKDRQNWRENIIISIKPKYKDRKVEDIKKFTGLCKNIIKINFDQSMIECAIRLGKATNDKQRPLLISLKEESNK